MKVLRVIPSLPLLVSAVLLIWNLLPVPRFSSLRALFHVYYYRSGNRGPELLLLCPATIILGLEAAWFVSLDTLLTGRGLPILLAGLAVPAAVLVVARWFCLKDAARHLGRIPATPARGRSPRLQRTRKKSNLPPSLTPDGFRDK